MKKIIYLILPIILILLTIVWYKYNLRPIYTSKVEEIKIPENTGDEETAELLAEKKLIRSSLAFRIYAFLSQKDKQIKPGNYLISSDLSIPEILDILVLGKVLIFKVTIPEGMKISETDVYLSEHYKDYGFKTGDFEKAVESYKTKLSEGLISVLPQLRNDDLEGIFLGDTYFLNKGDSAEKLVAKMVANFQEKALPFFNSKLPEPLKNNYEAITLASLVEQEAKTKTDRQLVAGIFLARLKNSDFLQSCASINYLLPEKKGRLSDSDIAIDSPYNTYKKKGLVPTPICNPSLESLDAVMHPKVSNYYYFLSDKSGKLFFSETLEEHNQLQQQIWGSV